MTIFEMLSQSGILTILGTSLVFAFLGIMVLCVTAMGKFFQAREAAGVLSAPAVEAPVSQASATEKNMAIIAAITAAVHEYRK